MLFKTVWQLILWKLVLSHESLQTATWGELYRAGLVALACTGGATAAGKGTAVSSSSCRRLCARSGGLTHTTQLLLELVTDEVLEFRQDMGSRMVWRRDCRNKLGTGGPSTAEKECY